MAKRPITEDYCNELQPLALVFLLQSVVRAVHCLQFPIAQDLDKQDALRTNTQERRMAIANDAVSKVPTKVTDEEQRKRLDPALLRRLYTYMLKCRMRSEERRTQIGRASCRER